MGSEMRTVDLSVRWTHAAILIAVVAVSIVQPVDGVSTQQDLQEVDADVKWVYVPDVSAKKMAKKAKAAAKVLARAKPGHWEKSQPGLTAAQLSKKKALLKAKLLNGAKAARRAARKKARLKREVMRSKERVKKTKKKLKSEKKDIKKSRAAAKEAKAESKKVNGMKDMQAFMTAEQKANKTKKIQQKSEEKSKKVLLKEKKARHRRKKALQKEKKVALKKKAKAYYRK